ncbi:MAG: glycosyltransferase family 2 protein, partial [Sphaerospermopsis kisseleviana]
IQPTLTNLLTGKKLMKLSVIIPTYERGEVLLDTIESLQRLMTPEFEPTFRTLNCHRSKKPLK